MILSKNIKIISNSLLIGLVSCCITTFSMNFRVKPFELSVSLIGNKIGDFIVKIAFPAREDLEITTDENVQKLRQEFFNIPGEFVYREKQYSRDYTYSKFETEQLYLANIRDDVPSYKKKANLIQNEKQREQTKQALQELEKAIPEFLALFSVLPRQVFRWEKVNEWKKEKKGELYTFEKPANGEYQWYKGRLVDLQASEQPRQGERVAPNQQRAIDINNDSSEVSVSLRAVYAAIQELGAALGVRVPDPGQNALYRKRYLRGLIAGGVFTAAAGLYAYKNPTIIRDVADKWAQIADYGYKTIQSIGNYIPASVKDNKFTRGVGAAKSWLTSKWQ